MYVYFIKFSTKKLGLNTILTNQFQTYLFPTFIIPKFLKFHSWFTINPTEGSIVSKWNLNEIWIYFLVFLWKTASFFNLKTFGNFLNIIYHAFTLQRYTLVFRLNLQNSICNVCAYCIEQKNWLNVSLVDEGITYAIQTFVQVQLNPKKSFLQ
jgi:hypothetical protein